MIRPEVFKKHLGVSQGTATRQLLRKILFSLVVQLGRDICYRCSSKIEEKDFSIEHKEPWLYVSSDLFWDLSNIAFSHRKCNSKAARKFKGVRKSRRTVGFSRDVSWCSYHKKFLPVELFSKNKSIWNGLQRQCNSCRKKRNKQP